MSKILVVDDDPDFVEATRMVLEAGGYQVVCAADGDEGLLPRPDDRALRLTRNAVGRQLQALAWDERQKRWLPSRGDAPFQAAASDALAGAFVVEFAVPLDVLGPGAPGLPRVIGLGARAAITR